MITDKFARRSISDQTGSYSYEVSLSVDSTMGSCEFGFSGDHVLGFRLESGKVYDRNDRYVYSYDADSSVVFSGDVLPTSDDLYINETPIYFQNPKPQGKVSYFYIDPKGVEATFSTFIRGERPNFEYDTFSPYKSGDVVSGRFINNNPDVAFRIFSGDILKETNFELSGITEGDITNTGYFYLVAKDTDGFIDDIPLRFYANFGTVDFTFHASGEPLGYIESADIYLSIVDAQEAFILNDSTEDFLVKYRNPNSAKITASLTYFSGFTGDVFTDVLVTKEAHRIVEGFIEGEGYISNYIDDEVVSYVDASGDMQFGTASGQIQAFGYATGEILYAFNVMGEGLGTGYIYMDVPASGLSESTFTGYVPLFGGGTLTGSAFDIDATGSFIFNDSNFRAVGRIQSGVAEVFVPQYLGELGPVNLDSSFYSQEYLSQMVVATGVASREYSLVATGLVSGITRLGVVDDRFFANLEYGNFTFTKEFEGFLTAEGIKTYTIEEIVSGKAPAKMIEWPVKGVFSDLIEIRDCTIPVPEMEISGEVGDCLQGLSLISCQDCDVWNHNWNLCNSERISFFTDHLYNSRFWEFCEGYIAFEYIDPVHPNGWTINSGPVIGPPIDPPPEVEDAYIVIYVDTSGSMNNELPAIRSMVENLKTLLLSHFGPSYDTNRVVIREIGNERWASWMQLSEISFSKPKSQTNAIVFVYQNEAHSVYHDSNNGNLITPTFNQELASLASAMGEFAFYRGKIFSVMPDPHRYANQPPWYTAFETSLGIAMSRGTLDQGQNRKIEAHYQTPANRRAEEYLAQIIQILNSV